MSDISAHIEHTLKLWQRCVQTGSVDDYESLHTHLRELETATRETFQNRLREACEKVIRKLERGVPLTAEDRNVVELLLVGDADFYLKYENDFDNWQTELKRLMTALETVKTAETFTQNDLLRIRAFCRDGLGVLVSLTTYLREQERLQSFRANTWSNLSPEMATILADILRNMMSSPKM